MYFCKYNYYRFIVAVVEYNTWMMWIVLIHFIEISPVWIKKIKNKIELPLIKHFSNNKME